jgi:hypothetical protein
MGFRQFMLRSLEKVNIEWDLVRVTIGSNLATIPSSFSDCPNLKIVDLREAKPGLSFSGKFASCPAVETIIISDATPPNWYPVTVGTGNTKRGITTVYVPDESVEAYQESTKWNVSGNIIKPVSELPASLL